MDGVENVMVIHIRVRVDIWKRVLDRLFCEYRECAIAFHCQ